MQSPYSNTRDFTCMNFAPYPSTENFKPTKVDDKIGNDMIDLGFDRKNRKKMW